MNMKRITLIAFLLLAILTIGAVSASDDAISDGLNATDDSEVIASGGAVYDDEDHGIVVNEYDGDDGDDEGIDLRDDTEEIATIYLPENTDRGSFQIRNGEKIVARLDVADNDDWDVDEGVLEGTIYVENFDKSKVSDGDVLSFLFFEDTDMDPVDFFTLKYGVKITGSTMFLTEIEDYGGDEFGD